MLDRIVLLTVAAASVLTVAAAVFDDDSFWGQREDPPQRQVEDSTFSLQYAQSLFGENPVAGKGLSLESSVVTENGLGHAPPRLRRCLKPKSTFLIKADSARCFSCMSRFYEAVWPALAHVYKRPRNFTDHCNDDVIDPRYVSVVDCPTICIRMWEEPTVAGVRIRGHIRGCLDDLLHNGFNQTIVTWYRWMHRDSCRQYRKRELFKLNADESDDSYVNVCTCYADHCNSAGSGSRATVPLLTVLLTLVATRWL